MWILLSDVEISISLVVVLLILEKFVYATGKR